MSTGNYDIPAKTPSVLGHCDAHEIRISSSSNSWSLPSKSGQRPSGLIEAGPTENYEVEAEVMRSQDGDKEHRKSDSEISGP